MVTEIIWTEPAKNKLREISDYYKKKAGKRTAQKIRNEIYSRVAILSTNPRAGAQEELLKDKTQEFRFLVEGNYKIIYWLEPGKVLISTVFNCRRNPEKIRKIISKKE